MNDTPTGSSSGQGARDPGDTIDVEWETVDD